MQARRGFKAFREFVVILGPKEILVVKVLRGTLALRDQQEILDQRDQQARREILAPKVLEVFRVLLDLLGLPVRWGLKV